MINTPIWIEMRVKDENRIIDRFDKNKQQSIEYLGYNMEKAKEKHLKRITHQLKRYIPFHLFILVTSP